VTLQSIADRVGVSRMTVSNAFSKPDQLSADLRERILRTAEELGYGGPDPAARALASGRTGSVGMLMTDTLRTVLDDDFSGDFLAAVSEQLAAQGTALTLLAPGEGAPVPGRDVAMDGILVYACRETSEELAAVRRRGIPIVTVDQVPVDDAGSVNVDDLTGARLAAEHVVGLGHRRIGILTSSPVDSPDHASSAKLPGRERMTGWLAVLDEAGIEPVVAETQYLDREGSYRAARGLLEREDRPTALLCIADSIAIPAMAAARDLGLRVPEDVSVVGYDDSRSAATASPPLTTVRQDVNEKGRRAAAMLLAAIADGGGATPEPERFLLPVSLVVRASTAPAPDLT
jgi:DNA-binding LacI/PurR family transcriptional regulator